MKAFKDLEGKIPAKEGDRVALIRQTYDQNLDLIQAKRNRRPIMHGGKPTFKTEVFYKRWLKKWFQTGRAKGGG